MVIAVVVQALWRLGRSALKTRWLALFGAVAAAQLGRAALFDPVTVALAAASALLLLRYRLNSAWLVLGGAAAGMLARG